MALVKQNKTTFSIFPVNTRQFVIDEISANILVFASLTSLSYKNNKADGIWVIEKQEIIATAVIVNFLSFS